MMSIEYLVRDDDAALLARVGENAPTAVRTV